ncbi:hypothetical protein ABG067_008320 [Albugo candida]
MDTALRQQIQAIEFKKEMSMTTQLNGLRQHPVFSKVTRQISVYALKVVYKEFSKVKVSLLSTEKEHQLGKCTGVFKKTMGLPCCHVIQQTMSKKGSLSKEQFHRQWWLNAPALHEMVLLPLPDPPLFNEHNLPVFAD